MSDTVQREYLAAIIMFGEIDLINDLAKMFGKLVYNPIALYNACDAWMVLVWQNCVHSPNFLPAKHFRYTV